MSILKAFGLSFRRGGKKQKTPGESAIQEFLVNALATSLQVPVAEIDVQSSFADLGLDSLQSVNLSGDLEEFLGRRLSETIAWDYPTIEKLARFLSGGDQPPAPLEEAIDSITPL